RTKSDAGRNVCSANGTGHSVPHLPNRVNPTASVIQNEEATIKGSASLRIPKFVGLLADELQTTVGKASHEDAAFINREWRWFFLLRGGELFFAERHRVGCCFGIANQAVAPADAPYVFLRFAVRRHAVAVLDYRAFAGVVSGQRERHISVKQLEQESQVAGAALDVLLRVPYVGYPEPDGRRRH